MFDGILVCRAGVAEDDDHISLISVLCELTGTVWTQVRRIQAQSMPSVRVRSVREAVKLAAGHEVVRVSTGVGSSLSSVSEESAVEERVGEGRRVQKW